MAMHCAQENTVDVVVHECQVLTNIYELFEFSILTYLVVFLCLIPGKRFYMALELGHCCEAQLMLSYYISD